jgi:glycosyltransferase involved in cell wall biosynthesis
VRTAVLVPCYNEAATVGKVVTEFRAADPTVTVYVYDNNSTDDSGRVAREAGAIVVREVRQGKGWVVRSMLRDVDAEIYVLVDADDSYSAVEALSMRKLIAGGRSDMVMGDRISGTDFQEKGSPLASWDTRIVRWVINRVFRSELHDISTGCRVMSRRFAKALPISGSDRESVETEMTIHALDKGFLVSEAPVSYRRHRRRGAQLSLGARVARVLRTGTRLLRDTRPLLFFGAIAAVSLLVSIVAFVPPLLEYMEEGYVHRVPTLLVSLAFAVGAGMAFVAGVVLDSTRNQTRQFFEVTLTGFDMLDQALRDRGDRI